MDASRLERAARALEDALIARRDARVSILNAPSGLVVREAGGELHPVIRITLLDAASIVLRALDESEDVRVGSGAATAYEVRAALDAAPEPAPITPEHVARCTRCGEPITLMQSQLPDEVGLPCHKNCPAPDAALLERVAREAVRLSRLVEHPDSSRLSADAIVARAIASLGRKPA